MTIKMYTIVKMHFLENELSFYNGGTRVYDKIMTSGMQHAKG
jgi:hypothetical protein